MTDRLDKTPPVKLDIGATAKLKMAMKGPFAANSGALSMCFADCAATIQDSETKEELGEVIGCIGGGVSIRDKGRDEDWFIGPLDMWRAYVKAREALDEKKALAEALKEV